MYRFTMSHHWMARLGYVRPSLDGQAGRCTASLRVIIGWPGWAMYSFITSHHWMARLGDVQLHYESSLDGQAGRCTASLRVIIGWPGWVICTASLSAIIRWPDWAMCPFTMSHHHWMAKLDEVTLHYESSMDGLVAGSQPTVWDASKQLV